MKRVILPNVPIPPYHSNNEYERSIYDWMVKSKQVIEDASRINDVPLDQSFTVGTNFVVTTNIDGTHTGTYVANFLSTLVKSMEGRGFTSPKPRRAKGE